MTPQPAEPEKWVRPPTLWERLLGARVDRVAADGTPIPETASERLVRLAPPATIGAVLASLFVHVVVLIIAALVAIGGAQAGGAGSGDGPVEMAVMTEGEFTELQQAALGGDLPEAPRIPLTDNPTIDLLGDSLTDLDLGASEALSLPSEGGAGDVGGSSGIGLGGPGGGGWAGGSGGGAASFFGSEAQGRRFAYIVDVSGSMGYDNKLEILKRELSRSIDALMEDAGFLVVAFSSGAFPLEGKREWFEATDAGKLRGRRAIASLIADGATMPGPAFEVVFAMRPRPDAIYFMTDGQFDAAVATDILRMNAEDRIPIHCITFVSKEAEALMRKIATDSGGTYNHVPGAGGTK